MYNKLLKQQLKKHLGSLDGVPKKFVPVFKSISDHYDKNLKETNKDELIDKLRKEHEKSISILNAIIESTADGILVTDFEDKIIKYNKKFIELWRIPQEILTNGDDQKAIAFVLDQLANPNEFLAVIKEIHSKKTDPRFDILYFKDGRIFERYSQPHMINDNCVGRVWSFRDITTRKFQEEALKESEKRLRQIVDLVPHFIFAKDSDGKFILANEAVAKTFGCSVEEIIGKNDADFSSTAEEVEHFLSEDREIIKSGIAKYNIEEIITNAAGNVLTLSTTKIPYKAFDEDTAGILGVSVDITDRKKAEEALSNSESLFRTLTVNAPVGIFQTNPNGKISYVNDTWLRYTEFEMNDVFEKIWTTIVHPDDCDAVVEEWNNISDEGTKSSSEFRIISKKGNTRWMSGKVIPLFNNDKEIAGYIGTLSDITERKKADEALRLAQFTIENTTHAIYWIKSDSTFHMVNNAATKMLGFTFDELMHLNVPGIDPLYDKDVWDGFWQALIKEKNIRLVTKHIRKDGTLLDVQIDTHYFKFDNLEMSCAFVSDITERKRAETLLKSSEERYRQIVETAQEGIWLIDENDYTSFINKKMCEIIEYSAEEIIGKKIYDFMNEQSRKDALEQIERRKQGMSEIHDSVFITKSGKHVWVNISTNPVFDDNGKYKGALGMMTNITQRKLHEDLLRESEANLELKNKELELKNKELEQFAYVASHDLQEPLRTTSSFTELLQHQYKGKLDDKADKYLTFIKQSSDRMKVLIKDLLDYSRIGTKKKKEIIDCNIILQEILADISVAIKETSTEISLDSLPIFDGYPTEIKLLFQNLIINAIKFRKKNVPPKIKIEAVRKNGHWEFMCSDNGIGIEKEHSERIFIIFQRLHTRNEYEGSGIGLAHCKKIVELHGGRIWTESTPDKGSIFYFTIPASDVPISASKIRQTGIQQNNVENKSSYNSPETK